MVAAASGARVGLAPAQLGRAAEEARAERLASPQAYHSVRGQAVIKLYVVFNVLEIFDKLCASFGQVRRRCGLPLAKSWQKL